MKLKLLSAASLIVALGLFAAPVHANTVSVSSSTVTTIAAANPSRAAICLQNASTNPVYFSKTSSSATVNAGMILRSSATVAFPFCLDGFKGTVYGLADTAGSSDVRTFEILR